MTGDHGEWVTRGILLASEVEARREQAFWRVL